MKRLILVRHATAVDRGPEGSDFHRGLKKRGKREAQVMAERMAPVLGTPDQIFSSPADRALQTARIFADRLGVPAERVVLREELYGDSCPMNSCTSFTASTMAPVRSWCSATIRASPNLPRT